MTDACVIDFKGRRFFYKNKNHETPELFVKRCWFLTKHQDKFPCHILNMLSHAWIQQVYNGVSYDEKINSLLNTLH